MTREVPWFDTRAMDGRWCDALMDGKRGRNWEIRTRRCIDERKRHELNIYCSMEKKKRRALSIGKFLVAAVKRIMVNETELDETCKDGIISKRNGRGNGGVK
mmetsp:Transcript_9436/g.17748  ORF Transcript_9436/g.17748 Transcript_9436/m.17748 type:complete len:102 (+) Transcript_9436:1354-1659(+)